MKSLFSWALRQGLSYRERKDLVCLCKGTIHRALLRSATYASCKGGRTMPLTLREDNSVPSRFKSGRDEPCHEKTIESATPNWRGCAHCKLKGKGNQAGKDLVSFLALCSPFSFH